ncbi:MAG TPA: efflux RND transporter permease subunit [Planctomycetota bacterium]|nr:efflux RND transporter permease subunit [Planctomycetota bacterium]
MSAHQGLTQRIVAVFLTGNLAPLLLLLSLAAGAVALLVTPREEDPQIVVPVAEIVVDAPGASALEVERQVTIPVERIVRGISGIEYVYSMSRRGQAVVTARFFVGENREDSLVKLHSTLQQHSGEIPPQVRSWRVESVSIDDVPILAITLHSRSVDDHGLRRIAEELLARLQQVEETGPATLHGGRARQLSVRLDPVALASRGLPFTAVEGALAAATTARTAGANATNDRVLLVEASAIAPDAAALRELVIGAFSGQPVHLGEVAEVQDGPAEPTAYVLLHGGAARGEAGTPPEAAVTIAIAKRRSANAVSTAEHLRERLDELRGELLPDDVSYTITRDSGRTADGKVDELLEGLLVAIAIVVLLITMMLGWREAIVVALAVPITFGLTLLVNHLCGYSINRVTLFALILSLGLVVDDPIVDVENIHRHLQRRTKKPLQAVLDAVDEVRPPVIVATLAVILSFVPLFFITGMMGPYMRPMALNVPMAMLMSMVVAFTLTPWMSHLALRSVASREAAAGAHGTPLLHDANPLVQRFYGAIMRPLLHSRPVRWAVFGATALLFGLAISLGAYRAVPLKMLPFDNKTELQVLVDLDEGTSLERTAAVVQDLAERVRGLPEVTEVTSYAGTASPIDFNGLVRKYYLRQAPELGELRIGLLPKLDRQHQSHQIALRVRELLLPPATAAGAALKVVELPPGPPVLATVVAEVKGPATATPQDLDEAARSLAARLAREPGVVDVDTSAEAHPRELRYELDHEKAALNGIDAAMTAATLHTAVGGSIAAHLHEPRELQPPPVEVRLAPWQRSDPDALGDLRVAGNDGTLVALAEVGAFHAAHREGTIHRKNLERVAYVLAEAAGRPPAEIVLDVQADRRPAGEPLPAAKPVPVGQRSMLRRGGGDPWQLPEGYRVDWRGEGEWKITLDAFRDLGLAFAAACLGIYVLLVHETRSYSMPLVLMLSIPFTILGILPGFWLLNLLFDHPVAGVGNPVFFTATAMIGMIALSGIAVRNSIILIDFVQGAERRGATLVEAILQSGAVRLRPIVLTAGAAVLASIPITLDPIFSGLAWALIFGLVVSSAFTLVLVPVVYYLLRRRQPAPDPGAAAD